MTRVHDVLQHDLDAVFFPAHSAAKTPGNTQHLALYARLDLALELGDVQPAAIDFEKARRIQGLHHRNAAATFRVERAGSALMDEVGDGQMRSIGSDEYVLTGQRVLDAHANDGPAVIGPDRAPLEQDVITRLVHLCPLLILWRKDSGESGRFVAEWRHAV
ncbi:MAG: hypothetical protein H0X13_20325 [Ramlibacter sp.]|nr:hypothetical protein [Ramlibacter sp.]